MVQFSDAKNGSKTCSFNKKYLHSVYNPENEAKNFVSTIKSTFTPSCIIIIEPALSYCAPFLRECFPNSTLAAIRILSKEFSFTDYLWDKIIDFSSLQNFSETLFNIFGEETLLSTLFYSWKPSESVFSFECGEIWKGIKSAVKKGRDVLATRSYFSRRWLINSVKFCSQTQNLFTLKKIQKDILIAASGPSLHESLHFIKEKRQEFYLIAVSSAANVLISKNITPDLILSCDGGYWAKKHIEFSKSENLFFALTDEAASPTKLLQSGKIVPLSYEDSIGSEILKSLGINFIFAKRNGTVSGTALEFALALTDKKVYFSGLDLCPSKSMQHTEPNLLEKINSHHDKRLKTKETRQTYARFSSEGSLALYRSWFKSIPSVKADRVFRLSDSFKYDYDLLPIKDIFWSQVNFSSSKKSSLPQKQERKKITQSELFNKIKEILKSDKTDTELFPLENILIKRTIDDEQKKIIQAEKDKKKQELILKIERILF